MENSKTVDLDVRKWRLIELGFMLPLLLVLVQGVRDRRGPKAFRLAQGNGSGQSMVEFALMLPLLLIILMGIMDFGRAFYSQNTIANMAREGARYGSAYYRPSGNEYGHELPAVADVIAQARRFDNGLYTEVTATFDGEGSGIRIIVEVSTTYTPLTPLVPASFTMTSKSIMITE